MENSSRGEKTIRIFLVFLFLSIQFRFLFSDQVPDSVSLQNQYLIAQDYRVLFKNFLSSGYDRSLQGGSPTFYFQAPFFFSSFHFFIRSFYFFSFWCFLQFRDSTHTVFVFIRVFETGVFISHGN
ncbi:hypothetical protein LEP1GSC043_3645 [Leptospira weilii str. Ecochallenge]|uniref:Uncharacterized protein n=1 Tax=Leptospira weilii str. Ecochallenge TaxID=1049986 RepID=N1TVM6_9LEPT|nr:hypothetical protein LEP1GSC043_3645 [Leptospira weilii str. Ecochallenge]